MTMQENWQDVRRVLEGALELPPDERGRFLDHQCSGDTELRESVENLIAADGAETGVETSLQQVVFRAIGRNPASELDVGARIGPYEIQSVLGSGGMGTVFEALQASPRRVVALKIMRFGLQSEKARLRFEYESQVLGQLHHENIAQVYESGTYRDELTDRELPFFAMELVEQARTLDVYIREESSSIHRRLELFVEICAAVQHGHQRGFVHRDLKPGNILIGDDDRPKVIDFGIARSVDDEGRDVSVLTEAGQLVGTLQYMSPEQLDASDHMTDRIADLRSDVYALGVILYELLTGRTPFDTRGKSMTAIAETIRDVEPTRPSTLQRLDEDLDWIVLRAMEKNRDRRYASVSELSADVRRYLAHEPVTAGRPSATYRARKFVRRHRVFVGAAGAVLVALIASVVVVAIALLREQEARAESELETQALRSVQDFMRDSIRAADPTKGIGATTVAEYLHRAAARVGERWQDRPHIEIEVRNTIGGSYFHLGLYDRALQQLIPAAELAERHFGDNHDKTLIIVASLGLAYGNKGEFARAIPLLERVQRARERAGGEWFGRACQDLGSICFKAGEMERAERLSRQAIDVYSGVGSPGHVDSIRAMSTLVSVLARTGRLDDAEAVARNARELALHHLGEQHFLTGSVLNNLGVAMMSAKRFTEAEACLEPLVRSRISVYGSDGPHTLRARNNLASVFVGQQKFAQAEAEFRAILAAHERTGERSDIESLKFRGNLGVVLMKQNKLEEAEQVLLETVRGLDERLPATHWLRGGFRKSYGVCLAKQERFAEAEKEILRGLEIIEKALGPEAAATERALEAAAELYEAWNKPDRARLYRERLAGRRRG